MSFATLLRQDGFTITIDSQYYSSFLQQVQDGTFRFEPLVPFEGLRRWEGLRILEKTEYPSTRRYVVTLLCNSQMVVREGERFKIQRAWKVEFEPSVKLVEPEVPPYTIHVPRVEWRSPLQGDLYGAIAFFNKWQEYGKYRTAHPTAHIMLNCGNETYECEVRRESMLSRTYQDGVGRLAALEVQLWCSAKKAAMKVYLLN